MNKEEVRKTILNALDINELSHLSNDKLTYTYSKLYDKIDKLSDIIVIMGKIEFVKGEKSEIINRAKEMGVIQ